MDDNKMMMTSSSAISEQTVLPTVAPGPAEVELAPDLDAFYAANFGKISRRLAVLFWGEIDHCEDIAQEAFVIAYRHWPRIREMENPYGFVVKIAWNLSTKLLRSKRREAEACAFLASALADQDNPDSAMHLDLVWAILKLPEQLRIVVGLSLLGMRPFEIAATLGIPQATARTRLHRATGRLIGLLGESEEGPRE